MPIAGERCLLDTSAAISRVLSDHEQHDETFAALAGRDLGLAGHPAFETFSVLTRLPGPQRLSPAAAHRLLAANFPHTRHPSAAAAATLLGDLSRHRLAGEAVHDALVGVTALEHDTLLVSRDRRALQTYQRLGVQVELLP
jgi:predicted nucleic acid-binding protein